MTTCADLIARTERHLYTGSREQQDILNGSYTSGATTLTVTDGVPGIVEGGSLGIDLELFYVRSFNPATKVATVIGAQEGSVAANHANGVTVRVNPRFPRWDIFNALNDDLADLSSVGLFQVATVDLTYVSPQLAYDMVGVTAGSVVEIQEVSWKPVDATKNWTQVRNYELERDMNTSEFASGYALHVFDAVVPGRTMRVRYRTTFTPFAALTDDAQTVAGLPASANDLPPLGAALNLTIGREIKRNFTESQGDPRRAQEVPPGANLGSFKGMAMRSQQRIDTERARLARRYPLWDRRHG